MISFNNYVRPKTIEEAYELNQSIKNVVGSGMMWLHLSNSEYDTYIDLCDLGLNQIEENEEYFKIGSMVTLSELENYEPFKKYFSNSFEECLKHIVGVQFRNSATIGGSICAKLAFSDVITLLLPLDVKLVFYNQKEILLIDYLSNKNTRDILEYIIIPKKKIAISYKSVRKTFTDLPILNVCGIKTEEGYKFAVGSRPAIAVLVNENEEVSFGSNQRGSAEYRKHLYEVLKTRITEELEGN